MLDQVFTRKLIPELNPEDESKYERISLVYKYPQYTIFPDDESENYRLAIFYERQQIDLLRQLALQQKVIKETIKHGTRTAIAAIMSREDSHNIGSHVLAGLNQNEIRNRSRDVEKLMNYIQQRWDFIAGIIPGYPDWSEPLFFFSDILNSFFEQGLLLDYLIKDDGVGGNIIRFHIKYNTSSITFVKKLFIRIEKNNQQEEVELNVEDIKDLRSYDETAIENIIEKKGRKGKIKEIEVKFAPELPDEIEDLLIDVPGGVVGCHAFYCILENIMRNAAKYSYKEETGKLFELFIDIKNEDENNSKDSNLFSINISDNCSKENEHFKIADIQEKLKEDLVDCKGEIVSKDWGIQVIKLGTKYLRSPYSEDTITVNAIPEAKKDGKYLAYQFKVRKPRLVTVADFNSCVPEKEQKGIKIKHVQGNSDLENLVKDFFPQLLIILPKKDKNEIDKIFNYLVKNNLKFPARTLLCGVSDQHMKQIKSVLSMLENNGTVPKVSEWWSPSFEENWEEKFIIRAYKEWVWSFGKIKDTINIVVYLDRQQEHKCFDRWRNLNDGTLKKFQLKDFIKLSIYGNEEGVIVGERFDSSKPEKIILFDNHGKLGFEEVTVDDEKRSKLKQELKNVCLHYHSIGNDSRSDFNNRFIFDTLTNISPVFSGIFVLLLLIESAVTKVLVVDERVVKSLVGGINQTRGKKEKYIQPNKRLNSLQVSGCFVPFFLRWPDKSKCLIREYGDEIQRIDGDTYREEGLWFNNNLEIKVLKDEYIQLLPQVDFVVIHRGIFETFLKKTNINTFTNLCKNISSRIVITSGRGNTNNKNNDMNKLPFLEYSVVQRFIIQEFSKYQICRILFSGQ
ncbi:MAG: hypothetical protein QY317_16430 [Candidatus Jettenia caeni]|nr:MAG: hypothetical protein QY317_16430 [Candidatus Jettenia caeni]